MEDYIGQNSSRDEALESGQAILYISASMLTLVIYETCLFLRDEIDLVWTRRWCWGKLLYLHIKFMTLVIAIGGFYGALYVNPSIRICRILTQTYTAVACSMRLAIKVSQLLRAAALYNDSRTKKTIISISSIIMFSVMIYMSVELVLSYEAIQYPFSGISCAQMASFRSPIYLLLYTFAVIPDLGICIACVIRMIQLWTDGKSKLVCVMFRDTLAYVLLLVLLASPQFFTPLLSPPDSTMVVTGVNYIALTISGIAGCRMILNVRSLCLVQQDMSLSNMIMTSPVMVTVSRIEFGLSEDEIERFEARGGQNLS